MKPIQKIIHAGFAVCALASASLPALSWQAWPSVDFHWAAEASNTLDPEILPAAESAPAPSAIASLDDAIRR
jgi:hypothetical protein